MTRDNKFKKKVRAEAARTGEPYSAIHRRMTATPAPARTSKSQDSSDPLALRALIERHKNDIPIALAFQVLFPLEPSEGINEALMRVAAMKVERLQPPEREALRQRVRKVDPTATEVEFVRETLLDWVATIINTTVSN